MKPEMAKTVTRTRATGIPAKRAASRFDRVQVATEPSGMEDEPQSHREPDQYEQGNRVLDVDVAATELGDALREGRHSLARKNHVGKTRVGRERPKGDGQ